MKTTFILSAVVATMLSTSAYAANIINLIPTDSSNTRTAKIVSGDNNRIGIEQVGKKNDANVLIQGSDNTGFDGIRNVFQQGDMNDANIKVKGDRTRTRIGQYGGCNDASIEIIGDGECTDYNLAKIEQRGDGNQAVLRIAGGTGNRQNVLQKGMGNVVHHTIRGSYNADLGTFAKQGYSTEQNGVQNDAQIRQYGTANWVGIKQTGAYNNAYANNWGEENTSNINQDGQRNEAVSMTTNDTYDSKNVIAQKGNNNYAYAGQHTNGYVNVSIQQTGDRNTASIYKAQAGFKNSSFVQKGNDNKINAKEGLGSTGQTTETITQNGSCNNYQYSLIGNNIELTGTQIGNGNLAMVNSNCANNVSINTLQNGQSNELVFNNSGSNVKASLSQVGNSNTALVSNTVNGANITVNQNGNGNWAKVLNNLNKGPVNVQQNGNGMRTTVSNL